MDLLPANCPLCKSNNSVVCELEFDGNQFIIKNTFTSWAMSKNSLNHSLEFYIDPYLLTSSLKANETLFDYVYRSKVLSNYVIIKNCLNCKKYREELTASFYKDGRINITFYDRIFVLYDQSNKLFLVEVLSTQTKFSRLFISSIEMFENKKANDFILKVEYGKRYVMPCFTEWHTSAPIIIDDIDLEIDGNENTLNKIKTILAFS